MPFTSLTAKAAAHKGWAATVDRQARTRKATAASPAHIDYHLARLGPEFDGATAGQRKAAAESARKAHMAQIVSRSVAARRASS